MFARCTCLAMLAACSFTGSARSDGGGSDHDAARDDGNRLIDARLTDALDGAPDAQPCYGAGLVHVCLTAPPAAMPASTTFDTDGGCDLIYPQGNGPDLCVVIAKTITIPLGFDQPTGSRPLVLLGTESITIAGLLDVGSHRAFMAFPEVVGIGADNSACGAAKPGTASGGASGSGAGAGGTFATAGGVGGVGGSGAAGGTAGTPQTTTVVRGGCAGGDGGNNSNSGAHGGGAIYLISGGTITINNNAGITACGEGGGAGGMNDGGGGGGTGGMIGLDAPTVTLVGTGFVDANGGGGGEGGSGNGGGNPGRESATAISAGQGGFGSPGGGDGGTGGLQGASAGSDTLGHPGSSNSGGGGGGGGLGVIRMFPVQTLGPNVSPTPT